MPAYRNAFPASFIAAWLFRGEVWKYDGGMDFWKIPLRCGNVVVKPQWLPNQLFVRAVRDLYLPAAYPRTALIPLSKKL